MTEPTVGILEALTDDGPVRRLYLGEEVPDLLARCGEPTFAVLHADTDHGLTWATSVLEAGRLVFGTDDGRPPGRPGDLRELRVFGPDGELLVWAGGSTALSGRWLVDGPPAPGADVHRALGDISWLVLGEPQGRRDAPGGFVELSSPTGERHTAPRLDSLPTRYRLRVRHYLGSDDATGQTRVVASRLVALEADPPTTR